MNYYTTKLLAINELATGTAAFHFEKPQNFTFTAGQHVELFINNLKHDFSLASAPFESDLLIATRLRDSEYKNTLRSLPLGAPAEIEGPFGLLTLPPATDQPLVFLAGGIGITPFRSLTLESLHTQTGHQITLFYANRLPEDAAFLSELQSLTDPHFKLIPIFTRAAGGKHIDEALLRENLSNLENNIYFIAGTPDMNHTLKQLLLSLKIPISKIKVEDFSGY